jgi:uncharacterized protein (DUF1501 family)
MALENGNRDILVCIFQRGGVDGLNMIVPYGDSSYSSNRPTLAVAPPGETDGAIDLDGFFGLNPAMASLESVYNNGHLAVIHATGSPHETRSHFEAMSFMEKGILEKKSGFAGWIGRHLETTTNATDSHFRAVAMGNAVQASIAGGNVQGIAINGIDNFNLVSSQFDVETIKVFLEDHYNGTDLVSLQAQLALSAVGDLEIANPGQYNTENGADYPETNFGNQLKEVGQIIKADMGLEVACVDIKGWDTHAEQAEELQALLEELANSLAAFYTDMGDRMADITVVTMSEFGRRVAENSSNGTDHGHGSCMLALGKGVNGGQVYSDWPGLDTVNLYESIDLEVTTDFRTILGELVQKRLGNGDVSYVFPDYAMPDYLNIFVEK